MPRGAKPAKAKVKAKPPAARTSPKDDGARVRDLEKRLAEALEQQMATAGILRVISSSPTDLQPILDAVARSAARLCEADDATISLREGDELRSAAHVGPIPPSRGIGSRSPINRHWVSGRALLDAQPVHVHDLVAAGEFPESQARALAAGFRTILAVPLLREGKAIGAIAIRRAEVRPFSDKDIALLQTFADQAVIAIEKVRLFNETKEALEQQTATSQILAVISTSPTHIQPVLDAIAESAARLCAAYDVIILQLDGDALRIMAHHGPIPLPPGRTIRVTRGTVGGRAVLERRTIQVADAQAETEEFPETSTLVRELGVHTLLSVPLLREGVAIGAINLRRTEVQPFTDAQIALLQTFADQAVIAIENVRLFNETKEALERQTATSEILRVISSSPTDLQPVMDAVAENAARLCGATDATIRRVEGDTLRLVARFGSIPFVAPEVIPVSRNYPTGLSVIERRTIHIEDILPRLETEFPTISRELRTVLATPLLREGVPIGAIVIRRAEMQPFTEAQIALLQTFADQAVIAIENVRLFKELEARNRDLTEALEQQTATSEVLRVISSSPTDIEPVLRVVAENAARVCGARDALVQGLEGNALRVWAEYGPLPTVEGESLPLNRASPAGRAVLDRQTIHVADLQAEVDTEFPAIRQLQKRIGTRTVLATPLLREGVPIGVIVMRRLEVQPFSARQMELVKTFADQAVIAIENVRLFTELQEKNRALTQAHAQVTEALEQQTATSEILRAISSSPTNLQPVFDTIAASARRLCDALYSVVFRFEEGIITLVADDGASPEWIRAIRSAYPAPPGRTSIAAQAILERRVITIADAQADTEYPHIAQRAKAIGCRSVASVPMLRGNTAIGAINVLRTEALPFSDTQIELLKTFADQAVIAIENVRLFKELESRTTELTRSVEKLTALGDVGRILSSTLDLDTVLQTIVTRASQLAGTDACSVFEYDEGTEAFHLRATHNLDEEVVALARRTPIRKGEGVQGLMAVTRQPVQIPDIAEEDAYRGPLRDILLRTGTRALLAIPMLREDQLIGGFTVAKKTPGEFSSEVIELLKTFATQSALAIQNARLFREIADKSRQLETASEHKSEFLANMSHELRTPLNAIIGFSEVLTERMFGELNEKQEEYLKDIYASGQHLLSLINDILDLSKIEAGRMELELTDFDLSQAIDNALMLFRDRAARRGIALHHAVDTRLGQIRGDERKIKQVLLNLLSNALKFTPEGGRVEVQAGVVDGRAEISVTDTGVGIAPEDQEAVFEEFRQVGTADKKVEGTGLGLTLSRKFIELHGGRIWVKSQVGVGSTFTFTLPLPID